MKSVLRIEFECENNHPWNWLKPEDLGEEANVCPVCKKRAVRYSKLSLPDYPIMRIETAAFVDSRSGRLMGDGYYVAVLVASDLSREVRSRYPLTWEQATALIKDFRRLSFEKAAKLFARRADVIAGIPESMRVKIR